ncbi:MAG: DNA recombination protein RmuC [Thiomicrorhabdus chilensis]|uniref:DNA recombination protein RmuC n=1 Tax=Thiomicrorhabdus chilensis TaxID=63656 RepID=UPI00299D74E7|nr:DNA recombination protein RmuC [Thiomicrorhabdus chilensis]MDX1346616.1 DNA recombination protein RmuC [Thiomicrorhabdus chilensis]
MIELTYPALLLIGAGWLVGAYLLLTSRSLRSQLTQLDIEHATLLGKANSLELLQQQHAQLQEQITLLRPLEGTVIQLEKQVESQRSTLQQKEMALSELYEKNNALREAVAELTSQLENEKQNAHQKIQLLEEAKQQLANEFKVLANQIFESKQSQLSEHNKQSVESVLKPMQAALDSFRQRVETAHKEDLEGRASLSEQLKQLQSLNSKMSEETQNLTQALKGDSKTQGNWGELILERLLERSGLREGIEFDREKSFVNDEGKRQRPDVVINLPDNKHIVIDSKVSLVHYELALNSESETARKSALKQHLNSLKSHIDTLASKRYEHLERLNAPDFVLMFVPVEGAYLMAIEADASVFESAFEKRVAVVTPTTLFTTLKTIEQLWRYERQSENTVQLIKRAAEVHDKFVGFVETFEKVGKQLDTVQNSYNTARKQMMSGSGNLVRQAEMLKELAGKTKKEIPEHLLDEAEGGGEPTQQISESNSG